MEKTLTQIATEIYNAKDQPAVLYELYIDLAVMHSKYADTFKDLDLERAVFWNIKTADENGEIREKPLSDKEVEMRWRRNDRGQEYLKQKYILASLDKLMTAVKSSLYYSNQIAKNQY